jgi:hypothetical protein
MTHLPRKRTLQLKIKSLNRKKRKMKKNRKLKLTNNYHRKNQRKSTSIITRSTIISITKKTKSQPKIVKLMIPTQHSYLKQFLQATLAQLAPNKRKNVKSLNCQELKSKRKKTLFALLQRLTIKKIKRMKQRKRKKPKRKKKLELTKLFKLNKTRSISSHKLLF